MSYRNRKQVKTYDIKLPGWLGLVSLISYTAAVVFAPLAYPGYNWMAQAVSDLSAASAPSLNLWNQLAFLYGPCSLISMMAVTIHVYPSRKKLFKWGVYLFTLMEAVSYIGYSMFPLSEAGTPEGMQNQLHLAVTAAVVVLSIVSLLCIYLGTRKNEFRKLGNYALAAFGLMLCGAIGVNVVPASLFGIPERFSVFAAAGFNAVIGVFLAKGRLDE